MALSYRWQDSVNRYTLANTVIAAEEPVSLNEMKNHLRVDFTEDDALITSFIGAARAECENQCRRVFVTSTWVFGLDHFPSYGYIPGYASGLTVIGGDVSAGPLNFVPPYQRSFSELSLPISPVQSISGITYSDTNGATQTLDPTGYEADLAGYPATLTPSYGNAFPGIRSGRAGVAITFVAGYGAASAVPEGIKSWIRIKVATMYKHRESVVLFRGTVQELDFVDRLLDPYRLIEIA